MEQFNANLLGAMTEELAAILRHETQILKEMNISEIKPLLVRKQEIAYEMEKQRNFLTANPELVNTITSEDKLRLRHIAADYDEAMQEYQVELFKAQRVNAAIIHKLAEFVRDEVQQSRGYNKRGTQNLNGTELARNTPAIKYNESI